MQQSITFLDPASASHGRRRICRYPLAAPNSSFVQVQLDRDTYVDSMQLKGEVSWQPEVLHAAERCRQAGFDRSVFRGYTLDEFGGSLSDRWVALLVPGDFVEAAVEALREAEMDGRTEKLTALTQQLAVPLDTWLAPGEREFRRGVDYPCSSRHFLRVLGLYAADRKLRVRGRAEGDSVRVDVRPELSTERRARLQRAAHKAARQPDYRRCLVCDFTYLPSLADNRKQHRRVCNEHKAALWPCASPGLARHPRVGELIKVSGGSPAWLRNRFYRWSRLLCRECGYDNACNVAEPTVIGLLLADERGTVRAVAAVRPDGWEGETPGHPVLAWVWVPPLARRQGALAELWRKIEAHFGELDVEGPCSPEMWAYLEARGLLERVVRLRQIHHGHQRPEVAAAWAKRSG